MYAVSLEDQFIVENYDAKHSTERNLLLRCRTTYWKSRLLYREGEGEGNRRNCTVTYDDKQNETRGVAFHEAFTTVEQDVRSLTRCLRNGQCDSVTITLARNFIRICWHWKNFRFIRSLLLAASLRSVKSNKILYYYMEYCDKRETCWITYYFI